MANTETILGVPIGMILTISDLQVNPILPIKFRVKCLSVLQKLKTHFQDGHCGSILDF